MGASHPGPEGAAVTSIILESGSGSVEFGLDSRAEIAWTDELRTAYEYDLSFVAFGGSETQLVRFINGWNDSKHGPVEMLLYGLRTAGAALLFDLDYLRYAIDIVYPWSRTGNPPGNAHAADIMLVSQFGLAEKALLHPEKHMAREALARAQLQNVEHRTMYSAGSVVGADLFWACEMLLQQILSHAMHSAMEWPILSTPYTIKSVLDLAMGAVASFKASGKTFRGAGLRVAGYDGYRESERMHMLLWLIQRVHDVQSSGGEP